MKNLHYTLLALFCLPFFATAQITIISADMPQIGDAVVRHIDTLPTVTVGPRGANQHWAMGNAVHHTTETTNVLAASATPYAASFPGANIAVTNDNVNYAYISQTAASQLLKGAAGDLFGTGIISAPLNPDMTTHNFPRNYNSNFSDNYALDVTVLGTQVNQPVYQVRFKRASVVKDTTDGWGTITTPVGTYNALRVKRLEFSRDTIWTKLIQFLPFTMLSNSMDTTLSYIWLAKETKLPVAEVTISENMVSRYTWATILPLNTSVNTTNNSKANVFPSPASDLVNFDFGTELHNGEYQLNIYHLNGSLLKTVVLTNPSSHQLSVENFPQGIYIWDLMQTDGKRVFEGKICVGK
jgi:Secretion system C-terminal sorting domain